jgi:thymidine kinase
MSLNMVGVGSIEVICGPMFSGKTEELIRRVRREQIAKRKVQIFKPAIDVRYDAVKVVSHSNLQIDAEPVGGANEILRSLKDTTRVVAIDEIQFFSNDIIKLVEKLALRGFRVICAGLDQDYRGTPFGPMPILLALADQVTKVNAICCVCGSLATKTFRLGKSTDQVLLGEKDEYEARCRSHFEISSDSEGYEQLSLEVSIPRPVLEESRPSH